MSDFVQNNKVEFNKVVEFLKTDMGTLRTNRISASLVENISVEAYESMMPLIQIASINSPEPRTIVIQPWDKTVIKAIEKALQQANLGAQPTVDTNLVRLNFPPLTEERRKEIVKQLHQKVEEAKVGIRQIREKIREDIQKREKNKEFSEDDKFSYMEELEELVKKFNEQIKELGEKKEEEIMTI